jgi:hypothetical protein
MRWKNNGENIGVTSGYSMDNAFGAFMALAECAHQDGYTSGFNENAHLSSRQDLLVFLSRVWNLQ